MYSNSPLVDIVIAAYNEEKNIIRCIESIEEQTYQNYHAIVVDDGSMDNTLNVCKELASKNKKITVVSQNNHGAGWARNTGLKHLKGQYLCLLDSDDTFSSDYITNLVNNADNADIVMAGHKIVFEDKPEQSYNVGIENTTHLTKDSGDFLKLFEDKYWRIAHLSAGKLFKNKIIQKNNIKYKEKNYGEDTGFVFDYLKFANSIIFITSCGYNYYQYSNTLSQAISKNTWTQIKGVLDYARNNYFEKYDDFWSNLMAKAVFGSLYKCKKDRDIFIDVTKSIYNDKDFEHIKQKDIESNGNTELFKLLKNQNWNDAYLLLNQM